MEYNNKYGLVVPKKKSLFHKSKPTPGAVKPRLAIFNDDGSSDENGQKEVNSQIHKEAMKKIMRKQTKLEIQKAMEEDATVYEYDNIYDDMKDKANKKNIPETVISADQQKKPKYIGGLIKAAQRRNLERQRVEERKIEKEREQEGDEFSDKPQFVTSAYRQRMQERQQEEEEERRMAAIEDAMDVRKQKDLSGFYKHFLMQQVGEESLPNKTEPKDSEENSKQTQRDHETKSNDEDRDTDLSFSSSDDEEKDHEDASSDSSPQRRSVSPTSKINGRSREDKARESRSPKLYDKSKHHHHHNRERDEDQHRSALKHDESSRHSQKESERSPRRSSTKSKHTDKHDRSPSDRHKHRRNYKRDESSDRSSSERHEHNRNRKHEYKSDRSPNKDGKRDEKRIESPSKKRKHVDQETVDKTGKPDVQANNASEKFVKRTNTDSAMSARERYLARKKSMKAVRAPVEPDSD